MGQQKTIGILTAGGDSPGLNAAIRGIGKTAIGEYDMHIVGFKDGFRGLIENRSIPIDKDTLSGILSIGGTILGTSRDKPHRVQVGDQVIDMTDRVIETYNRMHLDALVCLGGGGTQKNAYRLVQKGLNVITLPKTIDNDVAMTDITFGFDTALGIATDAIDRLHSTAHSHHRIIVCEVMGHNTGWLALGAGIAGGADVILIPEIPYNTDKIADAITRRSRGGKNFSIVAVAEGAMSKKHAKEMQTALEEKQNAKSKKLKEQAIQRINLLKKQHTSHIAQLSNDLEELTHLESRVTILGHVQRGGAPSAADRLLATRLGTACARMINQGKYGVMVASRGDSTEAVPLEDVVGKRKQVPLDHVWLESARMVGINLGG